MNFIHLFYSNLENIQKDNRLKEEMKMMWTRQQLKVVKMCNIYKRSSAPLDFADEFITEFSEFLSLFFLKERKRKNYFHVQRFETTC